VTDALVLCIAWFGSVVFIIDLLESIIRVGSIFFQADGIVFFIGLKKSSESSIPIFS